MQPIISENLRKIDASSTNYLYALTSGTHKIATLKNISYDDLVRNLGEPSISTPSADNKIQCEWVLEYEGSIYTIYDWKTYDRDYTLQELKVWSIGGKRPDDNFYGELENALDRTVLIRYS